MFIDRWQEVERLIENRRYTSSVILANGLNRMEVKRCGK